MSAAIHHRVAIAGKVMDKRAGLPIAGAELELVDGPEAFQTAVAVRSQDPKWLQRRERLNRAFSRPDGLFYFLDLPAGGPYKLEVSVSYMSTRYGRQLHDADIDVPPAPDSPASRVQYAWVDIALTSTGVAGKVITISNGAEKPVARANVRIQDAAGVTDADGQFFLDGLIGPRDDARFERPKASLHVSAQGFESGDQEIDLKVGTITQDITIILVAQ